MVDNDYQPDPYVAILDDISKIKSNVQEKSVSTIEQNHRNIILVVDDDFEAAIEMEEVLSDAGFKCLLATNAMEALHLIYTRNDIGVLVTDLKMPGADGLDLVSKLPRSTSGNRGIKSIIVSGHGKMDDVQRAMSEGASEFMVKPIAPNDLVSMVLKVSKKADLNTGS